MFGHIRRHQKWLWIVISSLVIISFVWYFNPNQQAGAGVGGTGDDATVGSIYGEPINRKDYLNAYKEAMIFYRLNYGEWPQDNEVTRQLRPVEREARNRLLLVRKMKDYNIHVSDRAVADWLGNVFLDRETKRFNQDLYNRFIEQLRQVQLDRNTRLTVSDLERFARHQVGISHLAAIAGSPGRMVTPQEAERRFRLENEKADTKLVLFSASNMLARVEVTEEAINRFYTNTIVNYRLPERIQLSYVAFPASNYFSKAEERMATITNLNEQIDAAYLQRGPNFYTDLSGQPMAPEVAKAKIREEIRDQTALTEARRDAINFAIDLDEMPVKTNSPNPAENLENLAAAKGLLSQVTEPFSRMETPKGLDVPDQFSRVAFSLTPEEPNIIEPVPGEKAVYVFALKNRIRPEDPPLDSIRDRVVEDYRRSEARRLAREAGQAFASSAIAELANGKNFDALASDAGLEIVDLPPFSRNPATPIQGLPLQLDSTSLRNIAFGLTPGQVSSYIQSRDGGYVLYLEQFVPVADEEVKTALAKYLQELRREEASQAFEHWFAREQQLAKLTLAGEQPEDLQ